MMSKQNDKVCLLQGLKSYCLETVGVAPQEKFENYISPLKKLAYMIRIKPTLNSEEIEHDRQSHQRYFLGSSQGLIATRHLIQP
jgi:hypothetical protein